MNLATVTSEPPPLFDQQLPWHIPVLQRLEINTETRFGGTSFDDGDGLGNLGDAEI